MLLTLRYHALYKVDRVAKDDPEPLLTICLVLHRLDL